MVARSIRLVVLVVAAGTLVGCYDRADPDAYPLRLNAQRTMEGYRYFADLDGDGRDEVMSFTSHADAHGHVGLFLERFDGTVIDQVNMARAYRRAAYEQPHAIDLDEDGRLEVIAPLIRGDSLVLRVYDAEARFVRELFVTTGQPRPVDGGEIAWDPRVYGLHVEDVGGDATPELLVVVHTGFARYPRGVLALDLRTGARVGEWLSGAALRRVAFEDLDGDGRSEFLFDGGASRNGAAANGFSDDRAHAGVVDLQLPLRLVWSQTGDRKRFSILRAGPFDDGRVLLSEIVATARPGPSRVALLDGATGAVLRERTWPHGVARVRVGQEGAWINDRRGHLFRIDRQLNTLAESASSGLLTQFPVDIDADGEVDVATYRPVGEDEHWLHMWLDDDLHPKAVLESESSTFALAQQGSGRPALLVRYVGSSQRPAAGYTHLYSVTRNPWWWLYRYGPSGLVGLGAVALVCIAVLGIRRTRSRRLAEAVRERMLSGDERGVLLLEPDGGVAEANIAFRHRFGLNGEAGATVRRTLAKSAPEFEGFLAALTEGPPHRREAAIDVAGEGASPAWVVAEPLEVERRGRPYWLVSVAPPPAEPAAADATWPLLARRVVHDLKNPLTSILLTLQRMQMEAHAHAPDEPTGNLAARLDPYVERVEGRVEHLRRLAQNLLKFLDAASPELAEADLCAVVEYAVDELRPAMPPDVRLALRRCVEPVPVLADAEQVGSALENLVMNAVQAMPEGGRVTVQARVARRLQPEGAPAPCDYAVLEVLDTGRGMDAEARRRAFEPGFTTRDGGTGLGLALVQKVVRDHGGFATVESEPGAGTAVCLHLPLASHGSLAAWSPDAPTVTRDAASA